MCKEKPYSPVKRLKSRTKPNNSLLYVTKQLQFLTKYCLQRPLEAVLSDFIERIRINPEFQEPSKLMLSFVNKIVVILLVCLR